MAPSRSDWVTSETMRSGSIFCSVPRPSQTGQAPKGLLKEKRRGSISGMVKPRDGIGELFREDHAARGAILGLLVANSAKAMPSASLRAVSKLSARREARSGR